MANIEFSFDSRLDADFLKDVYEGDLEHVQMIFEQFVKLTPVQMNDIEDSFQTGAVENFRQKVHKLKPIFSFVGLTGLTTKAEILEKKCKEITNINEINNLYKDLKNNYAVFFPVIENELTRIKG